MDKQKKIQIEEMIGIIQGAVGGCATHWASLIAEELMKYYQPKIPEGSVVLSREEYEKLTTPMLLIKKKPLSQKELYKKFNEMVKYGVIGVDDGIIETIPTRKEIEKETAEKFERLANERIAKEQGERDGYDAYRIDNKAKYDGDIVSFVLFEICKEITEGKV